MQHLFTNAGEAALAEVLRLEPLLAFDFDGTLAPIVARPADARAPLAVAQRLGSLAARLPVAIVTGRAVEDVRGRLGFEPRFIIGNHGAEDALDPQGAAASRVALDPLRALLAAGGDELTAAGVAIEDKAQSIALHYRLALDRDRALRAIVALLGRADRGLRVFAGKRVVNIMSASAPGKARAVRDLVSRSNARAALFAGDDVNDEPVFQSAPPNWLTVRVGRHDRVSRARYFLDSPSEMPLLLQRLLVLLGAPAAP